MEALVEEMEPLVVVVVVEVEEEEDMEALEGHLTETRDCPYANVIVLFIGSYT